MLITEGSTTQTFVEYRMAPGVSVEDTNGLYVPGSVIKTLLGDKTSPILYGYDQNALAVLLKGGPVLSVGGGGGGGFGGGGRGGRGGGLPAGVGGGDLQPMSAPAQLTTLEGGAAPAPPGTVGAGGGRGGRGGGGGFRRSSAGRGASSRRARWCAGCGPAGGGAAAVAARWWRWRTRRWRWTAERRWGHGGGPDGSARAAVVSRTIRTICCSQANWSAARTSRATRRSSIRRSARATSCSSRTRPFWRNEPHGNYFLWFNAMLNWDHLSAGR